jgi:glycosyltransferase involved in cell wall biosynthesis
VVPFGTSRWLGAATRLLRRSPIPLGDLDQQAAVLRVAKEYDLVYSPSQIVAQSIGYLRSAEMFHRPIVWVFQHPLDCGRLSGVRRPMMRALLHGLDAYPALSPLLADELADLSGSPSRTGWLRWGPDPNWYTPTAELGTGVIAAGTTRRDFETLARAASKTGVPTWIVGPAPTQLQSVSAPNVRFINARLLLSEVVELYKQARVLAIPLHVEWPWPVNGLMGLMDALGLGKPVIVTRNPWIDLDVERLGIGIWVEPGDVDGWIEAIRYLDDRPEVAREMGKRARDLVDSGERSSVTFAEQVMDVFDGVLD